MKNASPGRKFSAWSFRTSARVLAVVWLLACSLGSICHSAEICSFTGLKPLPDGADIYIRGISKDGLTVVGMSGGQAFRWTADRGMVRLGYLPGGTVSEANAVSSDGRAVVGNGDSSSGYQPFLWTESGGMVGLGHLHSTTNDVRKTAKPVPKDSPGTITWRSTSAGAVSSDGTVVVGGSQYQAIGVQWDVCEAFRWTKTSGMVGLGFLPGRPQSGAIDVSANGAVVVGNSAYQAFRWTDTEGMVFLGFLPGETMSLANAVSEDGRVVVGYSGSQAFRWTASGGMAGLGFLPGGSNSVANVVSGDGSIVAGDSDTPSGDYDKFVWDSVNGMRSFQSVLTNNYHLNLTGWEKIYVERISSDGKTIVGCGLHNGRQEPWIAHLDRPVNAPAKK